MRYISVTILIALLTACIPSTMARANGLDIFGNDKAITEPAGSQPPNILSLNPAPMMAASQGDFANEFAFGIGYAKVNLVDGTGPIHDEDALRMDPRWSFSPIPSFPALRLGLGLGMDFGGSGFDSGAFIIHNGQIIVVSSGQHQSLTIFEPEAELSFRLGNDRFYVEPGIAGGGAFSYYYVGDHYYYYSHADYSSWASTFYGRAFLRMGFGIPGGYAGLEASYLRGGNLDIADNVQGDLEEMYIGFFASFRF